MKKHLLLLALSFINHGGTLPTKSLGRFLSIHQRNWRISFAMVDDISYYLNLELRRQKTVESK